MEVKIKQETIEESRWYEPDSRMQKIAEPKIRQIFARLFRGKDINLDDFYFTVYDDPVKANAYFSVGMIDGKQTIAVSYALIKLCKRTEEFAAVLGHEAGHYIWEELVNNGNNTIIQEHSADVNSVEMMINAGYNPRYVTTMQTSLFGEGKGIILDVHGNPKDRIMNVEDWLTKRGIEMGTFPNIDKDEPDTEWQNFKQNVEKIRNEDGYDTYLDKQLKQEFKTKDTKKINRLELLKFFNELLTKTNGTPDILKYEIRQETLKSVFESFNFLFIQKSQEEIEVLQDIFLKIVHFSRKKILKWQITKDILTSTRLYHFGVFLEQYHNLENLVKNYNDEKKAEEYAKKIDDLLWTLPYYNCLLEENYLYFKPLGAENVGKMLPWKQLLSYHNQYINDIYPVVTGKKTDGQPYKEETFIVAKINHNEDYFLVDDVVIAYGEEARKLNSDKEISDARRDFEKKCAEDIELCETKIYKYNSLVKYMRGELSYEDVFKILDEGINHFLHPRYVVDDLFYFISKCFDNDQDNIKKYGFDYSVYFDIFDKIKQSEFYKYFIKGAKELKLYREPKKDDIYPYVKNVMNSIVSPGNFEQFGKKLFDCLIKLTDELSHSGNSYFMTLGPYMYEKIKTLVSSYYNLNKDNIDKNYFSQEENKQLNESVQYSREAINEYTESTAYHAVKNCFVNLHFASYIEKQTRLELKNPNPSNFVDEMMASFGLSVRPQNEKELTEALSFLSSFGNKKKKKLESYLHVLDGLCEYREDKVTNLMYILWGEFLKTGHKCNFMNIIKLFKNRKHANRLYEIGDIFAETISDEYFNSLKLLEKVRLYEFMKTRKLFSEKYVNKNKFIKIIVNEILENKKPDLGIFITERFLTRRGVTEYDKNIYSTDFEFADEREKLCDFYTSYWANKLGQDDDSKKYEKKIDKLIEFFESYNEITYVRGGKEKHTLFSSAMRENLLDKISDKIVSQKNIAKKLDTAGKLKVDGDTINEYDFMCRGAYNIFNILTAHPAKALATIKFLNNKLTDTSVDEFINIIDPEKQRIGEGINNETLTLIHDNFWSADLMLRAPIMRRLLAAYTKDTQVKLQLVIDTYFDKESQYYKDSVIVLNSVYNSFDKLQSYSKDLLLAALLSAGQSDKKQQVSNAEQVGRGLKMFFQANGGAYIKFGQLLSYLPSLDSDIRKELSTLREKANIPTRDEVFDIMQNALPDEELKKISHVGKVLGAGSIYLTVQITYEGRDCVVALMRPNTHNIMQSGLNTISESIKDMTKKDEKFIVLQNIMHQAIESCNEEIDINLDYEKYTKAIDMYEKLKVHTPTGDYSPQVARWLCYGGNPGADNAYKIMEMAPGNSLTSDKFSEEEKHDMAVAYVTLELALLLKGGVWDTDRHQGQQNFSKNDDFRDFCIGIFDTGAQMSKQPRKIDKVMLGHLFYELIHGARLGEKISSVLNNTVEKIDNMSRKLEIISEKIGKKFGLDTMYIDGVQRGIIALSDIIEYQKEIKDENGNIIQESKSLTEQDLKNIIGAIMDSGIVDKDVKKTIKANFILGLLKPAGFKTLLSVKQNKTVNPISLEYTDNKIKIFKLKLFSKNESELKKIMEEKQKNYRFGIDKSRIIHSKKK